jgi:hypothetical protein
VGSRKKPVFFRLFCVNFQWRQPSIVKGGINDVRTNFKKCKPPFHAKGIGQSVADVSAGNIDTHVVLYYLGFMGRNQHTNGSVTTPLLFK